MSIRKQTRKSRAIGMLLSAPQTQCVTPPTSVSFCAARLAQSCGLQRCGLPKASQNSALQERIQRRCGGPCCSLSIEELHPIGFERIFARRSTAKVMLNRLVTAVPDHRDWIRSAWLTKRRQSAGPLERDAGGMKASRPSTCQ